MRMEREEMVGKEEEEKEEEEEMEGKRRIKYCSLGGIDRPNSTHSPLSLDSSSSINQRTRRE